MLALMVIKVQRRWAVGNLITLRVQKSKLYLCQRR
jgi:hypothetical protein